MGAVPITEEKRIEFRAAYLRTGNASAAAREVGINERTGREIAQKLEEHDPTLAEDRRALRARALPVVEAMMVEAAQIAFARIHESPLSPREQAELMKEFGLKSLTLQDLRGQYFRGLVEVQKALLKGADGPTLDGINVAVNVSGFNAPDEPSEPDEDETPDVAEVEADGSDG